MRQFEKWESPASPIMELRGDLEGFNQTALCCHNLKSVKGFQIFLAALLLPFLSPADELNWEICACCGAEG